LKDQVKVVRLRIRGLDLEVLLWQGLNGKTASSKDCIKLRQETKTRGFAGNVLLWQGFTKQTLGKIGSPRCRGTRP
jgi:hypothetical protein